MPSSTASPVVACTACIAASTRSVTRWALETAPGGRRCSPAATREASRRLDVRDLRRAIAEHPGRPGTARLERVLTGYAPTVTHSELEERLLVLCDAHGIPRPAMNARVAGFEVDACWPAARVVVELDGYAYHRSRSAFEQDRAATSLRRALRSQSTPTDGENWERGLSENSQGTFRVG